MVDVSNSISNPIVSFFQLRMTPLHWAVEKRHKGIVRMLLKSQADVTCVSKFGKTPIGLAVYTEQADVLAELQVARQAQASKKFSDETEVRALYCIFWPRDLISYFIVLVAVFL